MDELKKILEALGKAFEEYKTANDARIEEMKKGGSGAEFEAKLARIEGELKRLDEEKGIIEAKMSRPGFGGGAGEENAAASEHKAAFEKWLRKGVEDGLGELERKSSKAVNVTNDGEGGYAVPETLGRDIYSLLLPATPMRGVCRQLTVGNEAYKELVNLHGAGSGWVGETDPRPATDGPGLEEVTPFMGEVYALPEATQKSLDDIFFNVESWLAEELATQFALKENLAFTSGDGTKKPKGFLAYPNADTADGTRPFGTLQFLKTGAAADFPATNPSDLLIDVIHALKAGHRTGARWMLNNLTLAKVRKWKDSDGNYLWQPGLQAGVPSAILGYPFTENEAMPDIGANALCMAFGDFRRGYTVVDRIGVRSLRDPYTHKPYVGFYTTKRVGGFVRDSEAIKLIKCAE